MYPLCVVSTDFPAKATVWIAETVTGTPDGPQTSKDSLYDPKYLSDSQTIQDQSFLTSQHSDVPESFSHQVATDGDLKIVQYSSDVSDQMALSHSVESFGRWDAYVYTRRFHITYKICDSVIHATPNREF